jgi:hypothetical protein
MRPVRQTRRMLRRSRRAPPGRTGASTGGPTGIPIDGPTGLTGLTGARRGSRSSRRVDGRGERAADAGERGTATIEFVAVFLALVVPLIYAIAIMADVQRALLAVSTAAREVGRVYVTSSDSAEALGRADVAYGDVMRNFGYAVGDPRAHIALRAGCPAGGPPGCTGKLGPGVEVTVVVTYRVPVARVPFVGALAGPDLQVGATHHTRVDRYRGLGP